MIAPPVMLKECKIPNDSEKYRNIFIQLCAQDPEVIESSTLEIKGWCNDERALADKVSDAAHCLANFKGGTVLIGVGRSRHCAERFSPCPYPNVTTDWLTARVHDLTRPPVEHTALDISQIAQEAVGVPGVQVFALDIPPTKHMSGHMTVGGVSRIRQGKECRPYYSAGDDRTRVGVPGCTIGDLSVNSIRAGMTQHRHKFGTPDSRWSDPWDFLAQARLIEAECDGDQAHKQYRVSLAALILFGKQQALSRLLPFFETVLVTDGGDRRFRKNVVDSAQELCGTEQSVLPVICPGLSGKAAKELLVNAYVHRCYRTTAPVVIRVGREFLEIQNPGELTGGLNVSSLIRCVPVYRNLSLADGARFVGLCDKIGHGIDFVFESLLSGGFNFPTFESGNNLFTARVSTERSPEFAEFLRRRAQSLNVLDEVLALRLLWSRESASLAELATVMQFSPVFARRVLEGMQKNMIERAREEQSFIIAPNVRRDIETIFQSDQLNLDLFGDGG